MDGVDRFGRLVARAIGWSLGLGTLSGLGVVTLLLSVAAVDEGWAILGFGALAAVYGAVTGMFLGFLVGVPTALLTALFAHWTPYWRGGGALFAAAMTVVIVASILNGDEGLFPVSGVICGAMAAVNSWIALPRILDGAAGRASQQF